MGERKRMSQTIRQNQEIMRISHQITEMFQMSPSEFTEHTYSWCLGHGWDLEIDSRVDEIIITYPEAHREELTNPNMQARHYTFLKGLALQYAWTFAH
jgi:hypothetical protein